MFELPSVSSVSSADRTRPMDAAQRCATSSAVQEQVKLIEEQRMRIEAEIRSLSHSISFDSDVDVLQL